ncbi:MAG: hypothetical protein WHS44_00970 [Fimbriimonadales bacterium]|nr:MAG: hypothetical protein KatS3mg018_0753 [Fimbriimonadales bacterium]
MMRSRTYLTLLAAGAATLAMVSPSHAQRTVVGGKPRVTITPAPWMPTPAPVQSIFPTVKQNDLFSGSDFFPAAPTTLLDNTTTTGFYFPAPNIVLDDANIPDTRDTDGDNTYYLTQIEYSFYVPANLDVTGEVYIAGADSTTGDPIAGDLASPVTTFSGTLTAGSYILTVEFERCSPREQPTVSFTTSIGDTYDYFWTGIKFVGCPGPNGTNFAGMLLASGPDFEDDVFWWQGNQSCGGTAGQGYYWFGGNPRASFYLKVIGAATQEDAIVTSPDVDGNGCVDDADLLAVLFDFGGSGGAADVNCDGVVDDADLLEVLFNFGNGC